MGSGDEGVVASGGPGGAGPKAQRAPASGGAPAPQPQPRFGTAGFQQAGVASLVTYAFVNPLLVKGKQGVSGLLCCLGCCGARARGRRRWQALVDRQAWAVPRNWNLAACAYFAGLACALLMDRCCYVAGIPPPLLTML